MLLTHDHLTKYLSSTINHTALWNCYWCPLYTAANKNF